MKPRSAIIIFCLILASAVISSLGSYQRAERLIVEDMTQALQQTLDSKQDLLLTPDTILDYRRHLRIAALRERSLVGYDVQSRGLQSRALTHRVGRRQAVFRSYANCSPLTVFSVSDQRWAGLLWISTFLWLVAAFALCRNRRDLLPQLQRVGTMGYDEGKEQFVDKHNRPIRLTPMQHQLLLLFFHADGHRLSKQTICDALWPKKPDASETLYTLVRRLKPIVEQNSDLHIVSDRGKAYELTERISNS